MQMDTGEPRRGGYRGGSSGGYRGGGSSRGGGGYRGGGSSSRGARGGGTGYNYNGGQQNYNQSYGHFNQGGYRESHRGGAYWGARGRGRSSRGGRGGRGYQGRDRSSLPTDVEFLSELKGHKDKITCLCLDQSNGQLFTGSHDSTVRVWSCSTGECVSTVQVGGQVDSMLLEGGFLFVGIKTVDGKGQIKVWNLATQQQIELSGHLGRVQCLSAANGMLFSGGQDKAIRVWKVNPASGMFECTATLQEAQDGHRGPVSYMVVSGPFLFSGDAKGTIKVWDLEAGAVRQTLIKAHNSSTHPAIMSLLIWEGHLISGSLDGYIKIWEPADPTSGFVINPVAVYTYPEQEESDQRGRGRGRSQRHTSMLNGVLSLCGVADAEGKAVVMASYNTENAVRLFELPTFTERGFLGDVSNVRAMAGFAPGKLMMSGDERGRLKIWRWKEASPGGFPATAN